MATTGYASCGAHVRARGDVEFPEIEVQTSALTGPRLDYLFALATLEDADVVLQFLPGGHMEGVLTGRIGDLKRFRSELDAESKRRVVREKFGDVVAVPTMHVV